MSTIITREIEYTANDGKQLIGFFAAPGTKHPVAGILVGPEWWGRNEYVAQRAKELAEQGYATLAIDMYGDKQTTENATEAYDLMMETFAEPNTLLNRANAALATLAAQPEVDPERLAAVGFCFGGKIALELARAGAPIHVAASFHGTLQTNNPAKAGVVKADVLVCHGADDSMVSLDDVEQIRKELEDAQVSHEILVLKHAKHGFTNPKSDERAKNAGVDLAYNAEAEHKSFAALDALLKKRLA